LECGVWTILLDNLRPFQKHLPIIAVATAFGACWGIGRGWKSSGRRSWNLGIWRRSCYSLKSGTRAMFGSAIFAGLIVHPLNEWPWFVVMVGAGSGVVIDVMAANGPQRILEAALLLLERVKRIWTDKPGSTNGPPSPRR